MGWTGKTAVVCGGSSGLGLSLANQLVAQGVKHLILIARDPARLYLVVEQLRKEAADNGRQAIISSIQADLTDGESARLAGIELGKQAAGVDILIQAVGLSDRGTIEGLTRQRLMELIDANVVVSLHAIQQFQPFLRSSRGVIVLIGSLSSLFAPRYLGGYSIAKHALAGLAQQARLELSEQGVAVVLCCPGPIQRADAGRRYAGLPQAKSDLPGEAILPREAMLPGGGAKISGLNPDELANQILDAAHRRKPLSIIPKRAWWLRLISCLSPSWGDWLLLKKTQ
jgi:uncharacterized protein